MWSEKARGIKLCMVWYNIKACIKIMSYVLIVS